MTNVAATTDDHSVHFRHLADIVRNNLENQQDWTQLRVHLSHDDDGADRVDPGQRARSRPPRILLSGLPPRRLYIHPDEQIEIFRAERALGNGRRIPQPPEYEWVLPMHLAETPSVGQFAAVFDVMDALPPGATASLDGADSRSPNEDGDAQWKQWRRAKRGKRLLLAVVQDDSSVVYYMMHDGIVKPRQN
ncbi:tRNA-intron endonuclease [Niveomyces insectorum RCEF 264]|uniref:tRNA-intron endonuclease n=1 Tax=Niveomyces insectorum RCEF 264 TaxID=1081102 RepID=A0A167REA0_9HYPO|nr:tRNA-intron endonuclease [Niveomyces insectorum RCEF 264]